MRSRQSCVDLGTEKARGLGGGLARTGSLLSLATRLERATSFVHLVYHVMSRFRSSRGADVRVLDQAQGVKGVTVSE